MTRQIFWNLVFCSADSISSPQAACCIILPTRNKDGVSCYRCWGAKPYAHWPLKRARPPTHPRGSEVAQRTRIHLIPTGHSPGAA